MGLSFGELLRYYRQRKPGLTQERLAELAGYDPAVLARMGQGKKDLTGPSGRERVVRLIGVLRQEGVLVTLEEANALLEAARMPPLYAGQLDEAALLQVLTAQPQPQPQPSPTGKAVDQPIPATPHNLLPRLTRLIGRESELSEVQRLIQAHRLVTLTGAGGVGKTRLAEEVGLILCRDAPRRVSTVPDGVWLVELAALSEPSLVPSAATQALGLSEQAGRAPAQTLIAHLAGKRVLLILDNCEHLLVACAELVETLLRTCPGVRVLATSREPLRVPGEMTWRVPSLSLPDIHRLPPTGQMIDFAAVQLFVERAEVAQSSFKLTAENCATVAHICRWLDGIPLALELAAARLAGLSLNELATRLDGHLALLAGGDRVALPRHQTLKAMLDWSHGLLSAPEQLLFRRLSVFAGGWTAEAAEAVCASDILPLLLSLVDKSLVVAEVSGDAGQTRYRMLEPIRQYAAERLDETGSAEVARLRDLHLDYFLALAKPVIYHELEEGETWARVDQLERELDNLRAALAWGFSAPLEDERGLTLAWGLGDIWGYRGYPSEGRAWIDRALAKWTRPTRGRAMALSVAGWLTTWQGDYDTTYTRLAESIRLFRITADKRNLAEALVRLADVISIQVSIKAAAPGNLEEAVANVEEALQIAREIGSQPIIGNVLMRLASFSLYQARLDEARRLFDEVLAIHRARGSKVDIHISLCYLAICAMAEQDWGVARAYLEESVAIALEIDNVSLLVAPNLARVVREQGDYAHAEHLLQKWLVLSQTLDVGRQSMSSEGDKLDTVAELGRTVQLRGDAERALALLREAVSLSRVAGNRIRLVLSLNYLAALLLDQGNMVEATECHRESLQLAADIGSPFGVAVGLAGLAEVARRQNDLEQAARLCGAAVTQGDMRRLALSDFGWLYVPTDWLEYDQTLAALRERLGDPVVARAWAEGERMTPQQAVDAALAVAI